MKIITVDLSGKVPQISDKYGGEKGEHQAVTLEVTPEAAMQSDPDIAFYYLLFKVDGGLVASRTFNVGEDISVALWGQLTENRNVVFQLIGTNGLESIIAKSPVITLYLGESLQGTVIGIDDNRDSLIAMIGAFNERLTDDEAVISQLVADEAKAVAITLTGLILNYSYQDILDMWAASTAMTYRGNIVLKVITENNLSYIYTLSGEKGAYEIVETQFYDSGTYARVAQSKRYPFAPIRIIRTADQQELPISNETVDLPYFALASALANYYTKLETYSKSEVYNKTETYPKADVYTKSEVYSKSEVYPKSDVYSKSEVYPKADVYNKTETYGKTEVYGKSETYGKTEVYNKTEVDNLIGQITGVSVVIVQELPSSGQSNVIYFVPKTGSTNDTYDEYMWISSNWEHIGSTDIDLSNYYTKSEVNALIPTDTGDLTNGAGFITSSALSGYATETWVGNQGYLTSITYDNIIQSGTTLKYTGDEILAKYEAKTPLSYGLNPIVNVVKYTFNNVQAVHIFYFDIVNASQTTTPSGSHHLLIKHLSVAPSGTTATESQWVDTTITVAERAKLSGGSIASGNTSFVTGGDVYSEGYLKAIPTASTSVLGGVKVDGTSVTIEDGVISAQGGSSVVVSDTAPSSPTEGMLWVNTDDDTLDVPNGNALSY